MFDNKMKNDRKKKINLCEKLKNKMKGVILPFDFFDEFFFFG